MTLKGVKIPTRMVPLLEQLKAKHEVWLDRLNKSDLNRLYELEQQGIIKMERGCKVTLLDRDRPIRHNKKHQRLTFLSSLVFGALLMSESWLAYLYTLAL